MQRLIKRLRYQNTLLPSSESGIFDHVTLRFHEYFLCVTVQND